MSFLYSVLSGVRAGRRYPEWRYEDLETTPYLYSGHYLEDLYDEAREEWQEDAVYGHMQRYNIENKDYDEYRGVVKKYENGLKRRRRK